MPRLQAKSFAQPDDVRAMPKARIETVTLDESTVGHCSFAPGWRWSTDLLPVVGTPSCLIRHLGYVISGSLRVEMDSGETLDIGPNTVFEIPPGHDKWVLGDEPWTVVEWGASSRAMAVALHESAERSLATVMFTDIANSTKIAADLGDSRWRALIESHNALVRRELDLHRGREVDSAGDGFLAHFDGPARAIRCASAIVDGAARLGLGVRAGVHTGECEMAGGKLRGVAIHIGARVMAAAAPGEVVVSSTVRDLVAGSGLQFADRGRHELKGVPGEWQLYAVLRAK